jgi:hypothetical protein
VTPEVLGTVAVKEQKWYNNRLIGPAPAFCLNANPDRTRTEKNITLPGAAGFNEYYQIVVAHFALKIGKARPGKVFFSDLRRPLSAPQLPHVRIRATHRPLDQSTQSRLG